MPFTVSHAAAVLPFRRLNLVWSAFIVGSMAPDFPYIVASVKYRNLGHVWPGVLYFTLPTALIALWLFHDFLKRPVIGLLPWGIQARLQAQAGEFRFGGIRRFVAIVGSTLLGIATHLVWDSFTHSFTWAWRDFRWLHQRVPVPFFGNVPGYYVAQYASTIGGMLALAIWVWLWYRKSQPAPYPVIRTQSRFPLAVAMFAVAGAVGLLRAVIEVGSPMRTARPDHFCLVFAVTTLALAFWQLILYCVLVSTHQVW